jgi:hypothetical protein
VTAAAAALAAMALVIGLLRRHGVALFLRANDAFEVAAERAPAAHAALTDLTRALNLPRPRLLVTVNEAPAAFAIRRPDLSGVGLTGALLERLTPQEAYGTLALLVALMASPGNWRRARGPEDWFAADALAATLAGREAVIAALFALASSRSAPLATERLWATLSPDVIPLVPARPAAVTRIARLNESAGASSASARNWPHPQ